MLLELICLRCKLAHSARCQTCPIHVCETCPVELLCRAIYDRRCHDERGTCLDDVFPCGMRPARGFSAETVLRQLGASNRGESRREHEMLRCVDCGAEVTWGAKRCHKCAQLRIWRRKAR
jgi:ribosomal protein L40E